MDKFVRHYNYGSRINGTNARINVKPGRGGAGIGRAFDDTGLPGGGRQCDRCQARGRAVEFEPGNEMAMSLQGDWNETSSSTRG